MHSNSIEVKIKKVMHVASKSANAKQTIGGDSCMNSNASYSL